MSDTQPAIIVKDVKKSFKIPLDKSSGIKDRIVNFYKRKKGYREFNALKGVSFEVKKGEFLGIVGRNGSGKSTLLKILAGVYTPDSGGVAINGSLTPFIELGVGFNPELTGRENVFLNGALLGFSKKEMEAMYDSIVDFAELHDFMEERLKNYSSGMQVRLAFSIAIRADSDILLLDEVLAVGDEAFQRKCYKYFAELKRENKTVILVTHSMESVQQFCDRAILIDKGHKTEIGNPAKIAQIYRELNDQENITVNNTNINVESSTKYITANLKCKKSKDRFIFDIRLKSKLSIEDPVVAMGIYRLTGEQVYRWTSDEKIPFVLDLRKDKNIKIEILDVFPVGDFTVNLYVKKRDRSLDYAVFNGIAEFNVNNVTSHENAVFWKIPDKTYINDMEIENVHR